MSRLSSFVQKVRSTYGKNAIGRGDILPIADRRISTGSLALDAGLGGGHRHGWITCFFGEKSGGKTTTAIRTGGIAQGLCRNCIRPAHRDAWQVCSVDGEVLGEPVLSRVDAHSRMVDEGYVFDPSASADAAVTYRKDDKSALLIRAPGGVDAVPPSKEELEEDPGARWGAKAWCDCFLRGVYQPDEPEKLPNEKPKEYRERVERWRETMTLNSYDEFVVTWIDNEFSFDKAWASKVGMDTRRLLYIQPTSAEEAVDILSALVATVEVDMLILDSIAQLVPTAELTESMEKWQQGLQARIVNKAVRKLVAGASTVATKNRNISQIWINQTREKIGVMFGSPIVKPGGKGQDFGIHAEVQFKRGKVQVATVTYGTKDDVITVPFEEEFFFKITKNRTAATKDYEGSYRQASRDNDARPAGTVIEDEYLFKLAMHFIVKQEKKGSGTIYRLGDREFTSQKSIMETLREDHELRASTRSVLLGIMLKLS